MVLYIPRREYVLVVVTAFNSENEVIIMQDFIYHNPVKILFGRDQISALAQEVPQGKKGHDCLWRGQRYKTRYIETRKRVPDKHPGL
jgi:hypothetical protein